jgi:hypothetical protein
LENKISSCTSKYTTSAPAADGSVTCTLKADTQAQTQIQNQVPVSAPGSGAGAGAGTGATTNSKLIVYEPVFTDDKGNIFKIDDLPSNTNINMQVRAQDADGVDYIQVGSKYSADSEPYRYDKCGDSCAGASDCARVCKIDSVKTPKKVFLRIYVKSYGPKVGDNVSSESQSKDKELTFVETVGLTAPGIENSKNCGEQKVVLSEKPAFLTVDKGAYFTVVACGGNQGVHKIGVNVAGKLYETECNGEVWCKYQFAINIQPLSPGSIYTNVQAIAVIRTSPGGATTKTIYDSMMAINTVEGQPPELVPSLKIQSITIVNSAGKVVPGGGNRQQWNIWAKDPFSVQVVAIGEPKVTKMKGVWIKGVRIKESYSDKAYKPCGDACKGQDYCTRVCYVNPSNVQSGDEEQYEVYVEAEGENGRLEKQSYHFNVKYVPNPNSKASKLSIDPLIFTLVNEDYNTSKNQIFDITNLPSDTAINLKVTARDDDGIEYIQIEKVKDPGYVKCGEPCNKEIVCSRVCKIAPQKPGNIAFHLYIKSSNEVLGKEPKLTFVDYLAAARANKAPNSGTGQVKIDSIIYVPYINPQNSYTADFIDYIRNKGNIKYHPTALPLNTPLVARVTASDPDGVFYITMNSQRCGDPCYGDKTCFRDCYFVSSKKEESKVYEFEAAGAAYFDSFGAKPNTYVSDRRFGEIRDVSTGYYESLKQKQTLTSVASDKVIKEQVSCSPDPECAKGEVYKGETYYCNSLNICYWCSRDASIANSCLYLDKNAPFCNAGYTATRDSQGTVIACSLTPNTQNSGAVNNQGSCDTCSGAGQCNLATHACRKCVTDSSGCKNLESRASYCMPGYIQAPSLVPGGDITCK